MDTRKFTDQQLVTYYKDGAFHLGKVEGSNGLTHEDGNIMTLTVNKWNGTDWDTTPESISLTVQPRVFDNLNKGTTPSVKIDGDNYDVVLNGILGPDGDILYNLVDQNNKQKDISNVSHEFVQGLIEVSKLKESVSKTEIADDKRKKISKELYTRLTSIRHTLIDAVASLGYANDFPSLSETDRKNILDQIHKLTAGVGALNTEITKEVNDFVDPTYDEMEKHKEAAKSLLVLITKKIKNANDEYQEALNKWKARSKKSKGSKPVKGLKPIKPKEEEIWMEVYNSLDDTSRGFKKVVENKRKQTASSVNNKKNTDYQEGSLRDSATVESMKAILTEWSEGAKDVTNTVQKVEIREIASGLLVRVEKITDDAVKEGIKSRLGILQSSLDNINDITKDGGTEILALFKDIEDIKTDIYKNECTHEKLPKREKERQVIDIPASEWLRLFKLSSFNRTKFKEYITSLYESVVNKNIGFSKQNTIDMMNELQLDDIFIEKLKQFGIYNKDDFITQWETRIAPDFTEVMQTDAESRVHAWQARKISQLRTSTLGKRKSRIGIGKVGQSGGGIRRLLKRENVGLAGYMALEVAGMFVTGFGVSKLLGKVGSATERAVAVGSSVGASKWGLSALLGKRMKKASEFMQQNKEKEHKEASIAAILEDLFDGSGALKKDSGAVITHAIAQIVRENTGSKSQRTVSISNVENHEESPIELKGKTSRIYKNALRAASLDKNITLSDRDKYQFASVLCTLQNRETDPNAQNSETNPWYTKIADYLTEIYMGKRSDVVSGMVTTGLGGLLSWTLMNVNLGARFAVGATIGGLHGIKSGHESMKGREHELAERTIKNFISEFDELSIKINDHLDNPLATTGTYPDDKKFRVWANVLRALMKGKIPKVLSPDLRGELSSVFNRSKDIAQLLQTDNMLRNAVENNIEEADTLLLRFDFMNTIEQTKQHSKNMEEEQKTANNSILVKFGKVLRVGSITGVYSVVGGAVSLAAGWGVKKFFGSGAEQHAVASKQPAGTASVMAHAEVVGVAALPVIRGVHHVVAHIASHPIGQPIGQPIGHHPKTLFTADSVQNQTHLRPNQSLVVNSTRSVDTSHATNLQHKVGAPTPTPEMKHPSIDVLEIHKGGSILGTMNHFQTQHPEIFSHMTPQQIHNWRMGELKQMGFKWEDGKLGYPIRVQPGAKLEFFKTNGKPHVRVLDVGGSTVHKLKHLRFFEKGNNGLSSHVKSNILRIHSICMIMFKGIKL